MGRFLLRGIKAVFSLALFAFSSWTRAEDAAPIVFVAPLNDSMPLARFENEILVGGIIKDLGDAIAARMGLPVRYVSLPSGRVSIGLSTGMADSLCYALPQWLTGEFYWSKPVIEDAEMIVTRADVPVLQDFGDLAGTRVGTVIAYHYPEVQAALGAAFLRDDAQNMELNIRKIVAGRLKYAIVEKLPFDYAARRAPMPSVRVDLVYAPVTARCALSQKSAIPFAAFDKAVDELIANGTVSRIMAAYR